MRLVLPKSVRSWVYSMKTVVMLIISIIIAGIMVYVIDKVFGTDDGKPYL